MRVVFVTFEYQPFTIRDAGVYVAHITEDLARLGHRVVVITHALIKREKIMKREILDFHQIQQFYSGSLFLVQFISEVMQLKERFLGVEQLKGNIRIFL